MSIADQLPTWIERTRGTIDPALPPKLNANEKQLDAPWLTDALLQIYDECADDEGALQALTDTCEQAMLAAGNDVSARFLALHLYYWLTRWVRAGVADDDDEDDGEAHERTTAALAHLTSLLPVEDCHRKWPHVRWEITNAYAAGLWKRATDLYDFAERESIVTAGDARLMRGHFRYVLALDGGSRDDPLGDVTWEPRVLGSKDAFHPPQPYPSDQFSDRLAQAMLFAGAISGVATNPTDANRIDGYRDARNDLEKGLAAAGSGLCGVYEAMLARCYLEVDDNANAARSFQGLLRRTIDFGPKLGNSRQFRPGIFLTTARSFRAAQQATDAASVLTTALREYPSDRALLLEQASLAEQETDLVQAFRSLKAATEADPEHEWDLGTRLAVVLGEAFVSSKEAASAIESTRKRNPEVADLIEGLVGLYWPAFRLLANGTRDQWVDGLDRMTLASRPEARLRLTLLQNAVFSFAKAVEGELRERVFKSSRAALEGEAKAMARMGALDPSLPEHRFALFVLGKEKKLTLSQMNRVLAASRKSREGLFAELKARLATRVSRLDELVGLLDLIVEARNQAVHEYEVESNAPKVHAHCQWALEILLGQAR